VPNVFYVSQLKKYLKAHADVIVDDVTPLDVDLSYPEHPVKLLGQQGPSHEVKDDLNFYDTLRSKWLPQVTEEPLDKAQLTGPTVPPLIPRSDMMSSPRHHRATILGEPSRRAHSLPFFVSRRTPNPS
jgi:hypothetical protein